MINACVLGCVAGIERAGWDRSQCAIHSCRRDVKCRISFLVSARDGLELDTIRCAHRWTGLYQKYSDRWSESWFVDDAPPRPPHLPPPHPTYSLTARVVEASLMTSQKISSIFLCGTCGTRRTAPSEVKSFGLSVRKDGSDLLVGRHSVVSHFGHRWAGCVIRLHKGFSRMGRRV